MDLIWPIVFTPDGEIGLVSQDDGSIGVFRLPPGGPPHVIHAAFKQGFYAGQLVMAPDGASVYVLDADTANNGGGVYQVPIGCDGKLGAPALVVPGGNAMAMALVPSDPTKAVLAAAAAYDSPDGSDGHLIDLAARKRIGSTSTFGDTNAIASSVAVTLDGKYAVIADNGINAGSRMAVLSLSPVSPISILQTPFPDGVAISPYGNAGIVLNDDSTDQIHVLKYDPSDAAAPITITGELPYKFPPPQIPITISLIDRGSLKGTTFVGENIAVRQLTFTAAGTVEDTAKVPFPNSNEGIVGVVGVQP